MKTARLLLVEDDEDMIPFYVSCLGPQFELTVADSLAAAREHVARAYFPIAIVNWRLPDGSGLELCRALRNDQRPYTYTVVATARAGKHSLLEAMEHGADDFLSKPLDPEVLLVRLRVATRILALQCALTREGDKPSICAWCCSVRRGEEWQRLDHFLAAETHLRFSHGLCPTCFERERVS